MAIKYRCKECGETIYVHGKIGQNSFGIPTPGELIIRVGSRCPKCGHMFQKPDINDIIIKPGKGH